MRMTCEAWKIDFDGGGMKKKKYVRLFFIAGGCCALLLSSGAAAVEINEMTVVAAADTPVVGDMPMGQSAGGDDSLLPEDTEAESDLFGTEGGYFHPYLSLAGEWTDNLYNLDDNTQSNFLTRVSPGIWLAVPRSKVIPVTITPHNTSAGGLQQQLKDHSGTDRYQVYALGGVDFLNYSEDSDLNSVDGNVEGLARYNMSSGLSLQILDRYSKGHDKFEAGVSNLVDPLQEFNSNIVMGTADWQMTEKLRAKVDLSNFMLDYDDEINDYLDRDDDVLDLYGYYDYSEKTSFFIQYSLMDVSYDTSLRDNQQEYVYGGIEWDTTEKLSLLFKAGYQQKEYDRSITGESDYDGFAFDLQSTYRFRERAELVLNLYRKNEETDSAVALDKEVLGGNLGYVQQYTDKITGKFDIRYEDAKYRQLIVQDRDETLFFARPALQYLFREWLMAEVAYSYETRGSSDDFFDYDTNTFFISINFAL